MRIPSISLLFLALPSLLAGCVATHCIAQDKQPRNLDRSKRIVEAPLEEALVLKPKPKVSEIDVSKFRIESPVKDLFADIVKLDNAAGPGNPARVAEWLAETAKKSPAHRPAETAVRKDVTPADARDKNPQVEPGLVQWHDDFESACRASKQSGKPVLLFHLLGRLDQRFT